MRAEGSGGNFGLWKQPSFSEFTCNELFPPIETAIFYGTNSQTKLRTNKRAM